MHLQLVSLASLASLCMWYVSGVSLGVSHTKGSRLRVFDGVGWVVRVHGDDRLRVLHLHAYIYTCIHLYMYIHIYGSTYTHLHVPHENIFMYI